MNMLTEVGHCARVAHLPTDGPARLRAHGEIGLAAPRRCVDVSPLPFAGQFS